MEYLPGNFAEQSAESNKITVLHVTICMGIGGIETWLLNILRKYNRQKFQMDVCLIGSRPEQRVQVEEVKKTGSQVFIVPLRRIFHFIQDFKKIARHYQVVMVHTGSYSAPFVLWSALNAGVAHRVLMLHNTKVFIPTNIFGLGNSDLAQLITMPFFNAANRVLATEILSGSKSVLDSNFPGWQKNSKYKVLNYGIDFDQFLVAKQGDGLRTSLGIPKDAPVVGHFGRFVKQKNHIQILRVAKRLLEINPDVHFLLVGSGPLRHEIELRIDQLNLRDRFHVPGFRSDLPALIETMDVTFFPSLFEGSPLTFIEAQVSGKVVVTGDRSEMREAIYPDNHHLCIVNIKDTERTSQVILNLLTHPDVRERAEQAGKKWAMDHFSVENSLRTLEMIIDSFG